MRLSTLRRFKTVTRGNYTFFIKHPTTGQRSWILSQQDVPWLPFDAHQAHLTTVASSTNVKRMYRAVSKLIINAALLVTFEATLRWPMPSLPLLNPRHECSRAFPRGIHSGSTILVPKGRTTTEHSGVTTRCAKCAPMSCHQWVGPGSRRDHNHAAAVASFTTSRATFSRPPTPWNPHPAVFEDTEWWR